MDIYNKLMRILVHGIFEVESLLMVKGDGHGHEKRRFSSESKYKYG